MGKIYLSVIILTKNEERSIKRTVESVSFADEIIVIDDYSADDTLQVIRSLAQKNIVIYQRSLGGNFSSQRNFGLTKANGEWVLFVDADEIISKKLAYEIQERIKTTKNLGFFIPRVDYLWGKKLNHGELSGFKLLRLARRNAGKWEGRVHEEWKVEGKIGSLQNEIYHYPHPTLSEFLAEINYYSTLRSQELVMKGGRAGFFEIISYPAAKFFINYFIKKGFMDGIEGFIFAMMMSFHSFLVRAKLWNIANEKKV